MCDTSLSKIHQGYGAMQKENKKMHTQRRYATCFGMSKKKRKKRDSSYKGVHTPSAKKIHTLAHLDQGL